MRVMPKRNPTYTDMSRIRTHKHCAIRTLKYTEIERGRGRDRYIDREGLEKEREREREGERNTYIHCIDG